MLSFRRKAPREIDDSLSVDLMLASCRRSRDMSDKEDADALSLSSRSPSPRGRSLGGAGAAADNSRLPLRRGSGDDSGPLGAEPGGDVLPANDLRHALDQRSAPDPDDAANEGNNGTFEDAAADGAPADLREVLDRRQRDDESAPAPASGRRKELRSTITAVHDAREAGNDAERDDKGARHREAGGRYDRSARGRDGDGGAERGMRGQQQQEDERRGRGPGQRYDRGGGDRGRDDDGDDRGGARGEKRQRDDVDRYARNNRDDSDEAGPSGRATGTAGAAKASRRVDADGEAGAAPADAAAAAGGGAAATPVKRKEVPTGRGGGAYIPPFRLKQMMAEAAEDKSSEQYQRMMWEVRSLLLCCWVFGAMSGCYGAMMCVKEIYLQ